MKYPLASLILIFIISFQQYVYAQTEVDYIGAGNDQGITVYSSSNANGTSAENTINGSGLDAKIMEASRFLAQSTMGADLAEIKQTSEMGMEAWLDQQLQIQPTMIQALVLSITQDIKNLWIQNGLNLDDFFGPWAVHFNYAWWQVNMTGQDLLRQRVAFTLSEIFVVSINSALIDHGEALGHYYDILVSGAFGSYKDLLMEITTHACMGHYLSYLNNPKTNLDENIRPDQNYAREIMQLFTIGLYELNMDGSQKLDAQGNFIPTYDNRVIEEMSKVFTGLGAGAIEDFVDWTEIPYFGLGFYGTKKTTPLHMYEEEHETGPKTIFNDLVINAQGSNSGMDDIQEAIDYLMAHDNTAPFVSYRLIQRLVKSNPSPAYISRIAHTFKNSQGDLSQVIKAILLDEEARSCEGLQNVRNGKLREPLLRYTHLSRSLEKDSPFGRYWNSAFSFLNATNQHVLAAPSVFNFFLPDHQPIGALSDANLMAPEFQIHNSRTSVEYLNAVNQWTVWNSLWWSWESEIGDVEISLVTDDLVAIADHPEALLNRLDILYTHGQLSDETRETIITAMEGLQWGDVNYDRVRMALYLILISPDYNILK